jgi:hypothetical protein
MTNPQKEKGTRWETAITRFLQDAGLFAYKPRQEGHKDIGDIHVPPFVIQAKAYKDILAALRDGVEGAAVQKLHARMPFGVAVVKRPRKPIADAYVVLRLADFPDLVRAVQGPLADYESDTD